MSDEPTVMLDTESPSLLDRKKKESGVVVVEMGPSMDGVVDTIRKAEKDGKKPIVLVDSIHQEKPVTPKIGLLGALTLGAAAICGVGIGFGGPDRKMVKCGLPGCEVMSSRDYCCAEHCREHRLKIRR